MKKPLFPLFLIFLALSACNLTSHDEPLSDAASYIDPFIGTGGHGHTYPGAVVPNGMMQLSPDTRMNDWDGCSGYHFSDESILGFSQTHLSGTGCSDYGDFRFMPTVGDVKLEKGTPEDTQSGYRSSFKHENESARAGYYSVFLNDYNIKVELTAGDRVGMHRYTFPESADAHVILDMIEGVNDETVIASSLKVENDHSISGFRQTKDWAENQYLYFYAEFSKPFKSFGINNNGENVTDSLVESTAIKAWFDFDTKSQEQIVMRISISAVDVEGAKNNLQSELSDFDFDALAQSAYDKWNEEMKRIDVKSDSDKDKRVFYSALYHTLVVPNLYSDADGRFRSHDLQIRTSDRPRYTVFSLWDTFRTLHPLYNLMQRERSIDIINTFLNNYETGGLLPVWELAANETNCMIGYHAIPVIADAYFNGIRGFDTEKALEAMVKSANQDHFGLKSYKQYGFIPIDHEGEAVSKTLEYAYDDWCIARMAEDMGKTEIAEEFYRRAQSYKNIYNPENKFFQGRRNGAFMTPFDPTQVNFTLTEANSWQYNFFVPQDINGHIELMGGEDDYEHHLDELFETSSELSGRQQPDITGMIGQYAHGNEPSHNTIYMYNFIGRPLKTQKYVKQVMDVYYSDEPDGYSGNEDCGQMSAWAVMSSMGFYPATPASGYYVLGVPRFERVTLNLENGKQFVINAKNLSSTNKYVKYVKLNGKKMNRSYINSDEVFEGGTLTFVMTDDLNTEWGTRPEDLPILKIPTEKIVIVPSISAVSKTFTDKLLVSMNHPFQDVKIYYTLDGSEPNENSLLYRGPFSLDQSTLVRAATLQNGRWSKSVDAEYHKIDADRSITLENPYSDQYEAGGDIALIDLQRGGANFRTGTWQGYQGVDLIATVDLGSKQKISRIAGSFLQDQDSWIFMPLQVEYFVSDDGKNFKSIGIVKNAIAEDFDGGVTNEMEVRRNIEARYVKMYAKNRGVCPDWHVGAGDKTWLFCDELVIE
jgi:alpha-1,2-mannosidase, putative